MKLEPTHKYDDVIHLPHPISRRHGRMSNYDRAAQFSPFAALTGFDALVEETGRLTQQRMELDEDEKEKIEAQLQRILQQIHLQPAVSITWFARDERKEGGAYTTVTGRVRKIDSYSRRIYFADGSFVPLCEVVAVELL